jgi:hypothetical protein
MTFPMLPLCDNLNNVRNRILKIGHLLFPAEEPSRAAGPVSPFEQFAVPYQFQPKLTLGEAVVSVFLALLRIFTGSILFALWGAYSFMTWNAFQNSLGRAIVLAVLLAAFLVALGGLMIAINTLGRMALNKRPPTLV